MGLIKVVGFGAMNMDELYRVHNVLTDDETTVEQQQSLPGGSAANTIYGLAKLGVKTAFIGVVGDDEAGRMLLRDFEDVGVDVSQVKVKESAKTGCVLGLTDRYGRRALYVAPAANSLLLKEDISLEYIKQAALIHLSSFVDDQQFELQKWVLNNVPPSVKVSFAPGAIYVRRGLSALTSMLTKTHILFINQNEIEELTGTDFRAAARHFLSEGCQVVVVTLGKGTLQKSVDRQLKLEFEEHPRRLSLDEVSGRVNSKDKQQVFRLASYVADANNEYVVESERGNTIDTTGAGDAFAAGFLYGLLRRKSLQECGFLGDIMARLAISKMGARAGLPTLPQLFQEHQELLGQPL